jgi:hypothetical protein
VTSNYAVSYKFTNIIDLQGKVKIVSQNGQTLETEQLYYDQKNEWFWKKFKFTDLKGSSNGQGIDFSKDFKIINSQSIMGEFDSAINIKNSIMGYLKFTPYIYLIFALYFIYEGIKWNDPKQRHGWALWLEAWRFSCSSLEFAKNGRPKK